MMNTRACPLDKAVQVGAGWLEGVENHVTHAKLGPLFKQNLQTNGQIDLGGG